MVSPTESQQKCARKTVERMFPVDVWLRCPLQSRLKALPSGVSVGDFELHAAQFQDEKALVEAIGSGFPAIVLNDEYTVPVSLSVAFPSSSITSKPGPILSPMLLRNRSLFLDRYLEFLVPDLHLLLEQLHEHSTLVLLQPEEAQQAFIEHASKSLARRIATTESLEGDPRNPPIALSIPPTNGAHKAQVTGCQFTVNTSTSGLRVFWSGAYYITAQYFGAPTTPAVGTLQSGTYVFGVDGGAYTTVQWDTAAICRLPGRPDVHLNF